MYIYIYVDILIIVFYLPYYCDIRYVVLSFDEIKTHFFFIILPYLKPGFHMIVRIVRPSRFKIFRDDPDDWGDW